MTFFFTNLANRQDIDFVYWIHSFLIAADNPSE